MSDPVPAAGRVVAGACVRNDRFRSRRATTLPATIGAPISVCPRSPSCSSSGSATRPIPSRRTSLRGEPGMVGSSSGQADDEEHIDEHERDHGDQRDRMQAAVTESGLGCPPQADGPGRGGDFGIVSAVAPGATFDPRYRPEPPRARRLVSRRRGVPAAGTVQRPSYKVPRFRQAWRCPERVPSTSFAGCDRCERHVERGCRSDRQSSR